MSGGKSKSSIKSTIMQPMLVVSILQVLIIFITIYFGGITKDLKANSYELLSRRGLQISETVKNIFYNFEIKSENYTNINNELQKIKSSKEVTSSLMNVEDEMIKMINDLDVDGAFVILDNVNKKENEKAGVFLRKRNNSIFLRIGVLDLIQKSEIRVDSDLWDETFRFTKDTRPLSIYNAYIDTYNKVFNEATVGKIKNYKEYELWNRVCWFNNEQDETITYTLPLINDNGVVYGVVGVEVSQQKLNEVYLKNTKLESDIYPAVGWVFREYDSENGKEAKKEIRATGLFSSNKGYSYTFELTKDNDMEGIYSAKLIGENNRGIDDIDKDEVFISSVYDINPYTVVKAYDKDNIKVLGVITNDSLFATQNKLLKNLLIGMTISIVLGIVILSITASVTTKPIEELVDAVKKMNPSKAVKLKRTNIKQLDDLEYSIENLGKNVLDNASKLSSIIDLVNMPIGAFEYYDNSNMVYCTDSFFKVTGVERDDGEELFINMEKFKRLLTDITKERVTNEKNVYKITRDGKDMYIRVKMLINDMKTLGVIVDVTDDILKKQKIEYERDHDVLTGLYNRIAFTREVKSYMKKASKDKVAAFLMWDLDSLKYVNDTFGHETGDKYIKIAAEAIDKFSKYGGVVGRIGGDEFTAFIGGFDTKDEVRQIFNKVKRDFDAMEIELPNGESKAMRASMGVAWYPQDSTNYEEISKFADYAMYEVKKTTKGALKEFDINTYQEIEEEEY